MPFASLVPPVGILALDGLPLKSLKFSTFHGLSATPIASKPFHLVLSHKANPLCPPPLALIKSLLEVFLYIYIYFAIGEKNRETTLSSLQACFVIAHSSGDFCEQRVSNHETG